jgi:hypothetical protein
MVSAVSLPASLCPAADRAPRPPVAVKFLGLFQDLRDSEAQKAAGKYRHVAFRVTATEINAYMRWALRTTPRPRSRVRHRENFPE